MKKILYLFAACLTAVTLSVSCDKNGGNTPQEPGGDNDAAPELTLVSEAEMQIGHEGGDFEIEYSIENPAEDGKVIAAVDGDADWCTGFDTSVEGTVRFSVAQNGREPRECSVLVTYEYADTALTVSVRVAQDARLYDYQVKAEHVSGIYYGGQHTISPNTEMEYWLYFSDLGFDKDGEPLAGGMYYTLVLYSKKPADFNAPAPPAGTYTLNTESLTDQWTISSTYSEFYSTDDNGTVSDRLSFTDAKVVITENEGEYAYTITLTDEGGKTHQVTYAGPVSLENQAGVDALSTLEDDLDLNLEDAVMRGYFRGGNLVQGVTAWTISMWPSDNSSTWCYQLYILCRNDVTFDDGIPAGTYEVGTSNEPGTMVSGYIDDDGWICGNWAYDILYNEDLPRGPMTAGTVKIEREESTGIYTFTFDCVDDNPETPHAITGTISGVPSFTDIS